MKIAVSDGVAAVTLNEITALELDTLAEIIVETQDSFDAVVYTALNKILNVLCILQGHFMMSFRFQKQ